MMSPILYTNFLNIDIDIVFVIKSHSRRCSIVKLILIYHFLNWWIWRSFELNRTEYHFIRHNLVVASKLHIKLVHNNNHLVDTFICSWLSLNIVVGKFFFKKTHIFPEYDVSLISTRRTIDLLHRRLLFLHGLKKWSPTFASLIAKILLCLHMQTNSVLEIELYVDQINILHLCNQSILP